MVSFRPETYLPGWLYNVNAVDTVSTSQTLFFYSGGKGLCFILLNRFRLKLLEESSANKVCNLVLNDRD